MMLTQQDTLVFERTVQASAREIFRAFTNRQALCGWFCDAAVVDAREGGHLFVSWKNGYYAAGTFSEVTPGESLAFSWADNSGPEASQVRVLLRLDEESGTTVTITHSGLGEGGTSDDAARAWEDGLENLQSVMESGIDLRFARRPMLGLSGFDILNPGLIQRLGLPVTEGVWLGGVVEESAAQRAGLQRDDVLVGIGDHAVTGFSSMSDAIGAHKAGDQAQVTFYRGGEKRTVTVEFTSRPPIPTPPPPAELLPGMREQQATLNAELAACIEGATEEEAEYRPNADAWNAKEILAHLICVERDTHTWMALTIEDAPQPEDNNPWHTNGIERLRAVTAVYSTLHALAEEFRRNQAETAELTALFPQELASTRKQVYAYLGGWLSGFYDHTHDHIKEIQSLLEQARR
ncbi:MAG TPA: SRPBCC domain-containing protein [Chloroflexia bacterium]|nr:SRPBCC domain-containing protein [Chloroflexia bacterium]